MTGEKPDIQTQKARAHQQLDAARAYTDSVLSGPIDPQQVVHANTGWTVRDVAGHILMWEEETLRALEALHAGEVYTISGFASFEDYNRRQFDRVRAMTFESVREQLGRVRARIKALLDDLPPEPFETPFEFPWPAHGTVGVLLYVMAEHEQWHAQEIAHALHPPQA